VFHSQIEDEVLLRRQANSRQGSCGGGVGDVGFLEVAADERGVGVVGDGGMSGCRRSAGPGSKVECQALEVQRGEHDE
jgi:hypothetical protein